MEEQAREFPEKVALILKLLSEYLKIIPKASQWTTDYKARFEHVISISGFGSEDDKKDCIQNIDALIDRNKAFDLLKEKFEKLIPYFERSSKKIPFFGDLSNGKSAVMNALLHEWVLPSTTGHTTDAMVAIAGWQGGQYRIRQGAKVTPAEDIMELHELLGDAVGGGGDRDKGQGVPIVNVDVPMSDQQFIGTDTTLVDCPGSNNTTVFDGALKDYCQDADVLVVVVDGVRKLTQSEKLFLYDAKNKITLPEMFFVINKWDLVQNEPNVNIAEKKDKFLEDIKTFCRKRLQKRVSENRIFFVSAKETLDSRRSQKGPNSYTNQFEEFECALKAVINQSKEQLARTYLESAGCTANELISVLRQVIAVMHKYRARQLKVYEEIQNQSFDELSMPQISQICNNFGDQVDKKYMEEMLNLKGKLSSHAMSEVPSQEFEQNLDSYMSVDVKRSISVWIKTTASGVIEQAKGKLFGIVSNGLREEDKNKLVQIMGSVPCSENLFPTIAPSVGDTVTHSSGSEVTVADWAMPIITTFVATATFSLAAYLLEDDEPRTSKKRGKAREDEDNVNDWTAILKGFAQLCQPKDKETNKQELMSKMLNRFEHKFREILQRERPKGIETAQETLKQELNRMNSDLCNSRRELVQAWKDSEIANIDRDIRQLEKLQEEAELIMEQLKQIQLVGNPSQ